MEQQTSQAALRALPADADVQKRLPSPEPHFPMSHFLFGKSSMCMSSTLALSTSLKLHATLNVHYYRTKTSMHYFDPRFMSYIRTKRGLDQGVS